MFIVPPDLERHVPRGGTLLCQSLESWLALGLFPTFDRRRRCITRSSDSADADTDGATAAAATTAARSCHHRTDYTDDAVNAYSTDDDDDSDDSNLTRCGRAGGASCAVRAKRSAAANEQLAVLCARRSR